MAAQGEANAVATGTQWVGDALDGAGAWRLRSRIPYILGFMMLFDSWDSVVIAYTLPSIIGEWHLSPLVSGGLISAGYFGQLIGATIFGALAERYGRLPVLRPLIMVMGVLAIACALAHNFTLLAVIRFIQGMAIGGALPVVICYVNEVAPTATRGKFFGSFQFPMVAGFGLAALTSTWIVPTFGWRTMFALGAIPLLFVPFLYSLPESPRWLSIRGRLKEAAASLTRLGSGAVLPPDLAARPAEIAERVPLSELFTPEERTKSTVTALLWFLTSLVSFGLVTWVPSIYVEMFHIPVQKALGYNSIAAVSIFILPILLRQSIDHIGRRPPVIAGTLIGGAALLGMLAIPSEGWPFVIALLIIGQIGISVSSMVLWPYTAETYVTRVRSVALGASSSLARGASSLTPLIVGGILQVTGSVTLVFVIFGSSSLIVALLWWKGTKETAGKKLGT